MLSSLARRLKPSPALWALALGAMFALAGCAKSAQDLYKDGLLELEQGNLDLAQERFEAAIEQDPNLVGAYRNLSRIYEAKNQPEKAVPLLEKWVTLEPFNTVAHLRLARYYVRQGRFEQARVIYEDLAASATTPKERQSYQQALEVLVHAQEQQQRISELQAQLAERPNDPALSWELGSLYLKIGQSFIVAGRHEAGRSFVKQSRAFLEQTQRLLEQQLAAGAEAASANIYLASVCFDLGQHQLFESDPPGAMESIEKAISLNPDEAKFYFVLAQLQAKDNQVEQAIATLGKAIQRKPKVALYHDTLSGLLASQGRTAEAEASLREADRLSPRSGLYLFKLAQFQQEQDKPLAEVIALLRQAIEKEPGNPQYRFSLSGFLDQQGAREESIAQLREVIRISGGTPWETRARMMLEQMQRPPAEPPQE